ncbi:hypothetical protein NCS57_00644300 [Fusarium keratoplasticum]|uniref:Uncharacterized protein n=1 Tax=Fusarium keratoplasticum TaxID=1328300 RepID=A0ACC0R1G0_9HYPO|nr:hypothetical protein NCS57_00644300 [Fusarium keratoplasticum]KAI8671685.1 hypothetical protein NCS57_00644300 [Fusarium keratoplasticum]
MTSPYSRTMLKALCLAGLLYRSTTAQEDLPQTIVGCDYLDCPFGDGTPRYQWANCTLADKDYTAVGFSRIPLSSNFSWPGLSWLYGAEQNNSASPAFEKNFYLGAPPETNFSDVTACAIFFRNVSSAVGFQGSSRTSQGTCEDAMSKDCVAALNKQAAAVEVEGLSAKDACDKVKDELLETIDPDCYSWARGRDWNNITSVPLSGPDAPKPISRQENSTSNCWPVSPKDYSLTKVESYVVDRNGDEGAYSVVPILTVFFPGDSDTIPEPESQMNCIKSVVNPDMEFDDENGSSALKAVPMVLALWVSMLAMLVTLLP